MNNITKVSFKNFKFRVQYNNREVTVRPCVLKCRSLLDCNKQFNKLVHVAPDTVVLLSTEATKAVDAVIGYNNLFI